MTPFPSAAIFDSSLSTQITFMPRSARAAPVTSPTYPVPTMQMFMTSGLSGRQAPSQELSLPPGEGRCERPLSRRSPLIPVPFNTSPQSLLEWHPGLKTEEPLRLLHGRVRGRHISRLVRLPVEDRRLARRGLERTHEVGERNGMRPPEVDDLEGQGGGEGGFDSVYDVFDVGVVAAGAAVAVEGDGPAFLEAADEPGDRHLRALAGAVHGEETQAHGFEPVEVMKRENVQLGSPFRRRVRGDGTGDGIFFGERQPGVDAIDGGRGSEEEPGFPPHYRRLEQAQRADDVDVFVKDRLRERRPHAGPRRQVQDGIERFLFEEPLEQGAVPDISFDQPVGPISRVGSDVAALEGRIVEVVEIVQYDNPVTLCQAPVRQVRADEARAPRDEKPHEDGRRVGWGGGPGAGETSETSGEALPLSRS